jgi:hypothetical protein
MKILLAIAIGKAKKSDFGLINKRLLIKSRVDDLAEMPRNNNLRGKVNDV